MWTDEKIDADNQYDYAAELVARGCDRHSAAMIAAERFDANYTDIYEALEDRAA